MRAVIVLYIVVVIFGAIATGVAFLAAVLPGPVTQVNRSVGNLLYVSK